MRHYAEEVILGRFAVNDADLGFLNNFTALRRLGFSDARMEGVEPTPSYIDFIPYPMYEWYEKAVLFILQIIWK